MIRIWIFILTVLLAVGNSSCDAQNRDNKKPQNQVTKMQTMKKGVFKYYQAYIRSGVGVEGKVLLNDSTIFEFTTIGGSVSYNMPAGMIKLGKNNFRIIVTKVDKKTETASLLTKANLLIELHGMNEPGFPDDGSLVAKMEWTTTMPRDLICEFQQGE